VERRRRRAFLPGGARLGRHGTCLGGALSLVPLVLHERGAERALGPILIVGSTAELHSSRRRTAAARHRVHVIELEEGARRTALTGRADEGALTAIAFPHRALHLGRDMARAGGGPRARTRLTGCRELAPLELRNEQVERAVEHRREIAGGDLVTQQLLGIAQL